MKLHMTDLLIFLIDDCDKIVLFHGEKKLLHIAHCLLKLSPRKKVQEADINTHVQNII